jgi:7-keto-8-aminopelargonate synthetase-like enzyme
MRNLRQISDMMDRMLGRAGDRGLLYRSAEDDSFTGRTIRIGGQDLVHFGSCSYLGLELHEAVCEGGIDAIKRYGTQFSSSRIAASMPLYSELEALLEEILGNPVLVAPTTSLAHAAALPHLIDERDAVILDQQVHTSVSQATHHLLVQGTTVEIVRHNRLDMLEACVGRLQAKHRRVWYLADGVYSMFGDLAPMPALYRMLERFPALHLYMDDAHGMSWTGRHGRGYVLEEVPLHERVVVATSLAKAFGVGGGVLVIPSDEIRARVRRIGSAFTFSGPLQPPVLGAAVASARLHLTDELTSLQSRLAERIALWNRLCARADLPLVSYSNGPIRFIGVGKPQVAYALAERVMEEGLYPTVAVFPAVPMKRAGLRFALNLHQEPEDLRRAIEVLAHHLPRELDKASSEVAQVRAEFELEPPRATSGTCAPQVSASPGRQPVGLTLECHTSIEAIKPDEWNRLLGARGNYDVAGLRFLEAAFRDNPERWNNWRFSYYIVRDLHGTPVLATFFTDTWMKLDMVAPAETSRVVEAKRLETPDYLTARVLTMGSMFSEGMHLHLDREGPWREALLLLLEHVNAVRNAHAIRYLVLRDLPAGDDALDGFLVEHGFTRVPMLDSLTLDVTWDSEEGYMKTLSRRSRKHVRSHVSPFDHSFRVEFLSAESAPPGEALLEKCYGLYLAVSKRNLEFNNFQLPVHLFGKMLKHPNWEIGLLFLPSEGDTRDPSELAGFFASYRGERHYVPIVCGLDYRYIQSHGIYRQLLRQAINRAQAEGFSRVHFGFGASLEKTRLGCHGRAQTMYVLSDDDYPMEVIGQLMRTSLHGNA